MHPQPNMLKMDVLKVRGLYLVDGRNYDIAIWDGKQFLGPRHKFGWMIGREEHYDADPHFGTVTPYTYIKQVPEDLDLVDGYVTPAKDMPENAGKDPASLPPYSYYVVNKKLLDYLLAEKETYQPQIDKESNERWELFKQRDLPGNSV